MMWDLGHFPTKPRMCFRRGLWYVYDLASIRRFGEGYTPEEAYRDWKRRQI